MSTAFLSGREQAEIRMVDMMNSQNFMSKNRYCLSHKKCNISSRGNVSIVRVMNLKCLRDEKKRLYTKMFLLSRHDIDSLNMMIPAIKIDDHFFESTETGNYSYFNSEDYDNNILMTKGFANASLFFQSSTTFIFLSFLPPFSFASSKRICFSSSSTLSTTSL